MNFSLLKTRALAALALVGAATSSLPAATSTLLDLNFNTTGSGFAGWGSTALTGTPGNGVSTLYPTLPADPGFADALFATAPTSGYLALAPNASAVTAGTYFGGWAANVTLATINSPYTAGGLGQTDLSKISYTARVRARGMPANGAVVILELRGSGDNPGIPTAGYKRIRFEPVFLAGNDWTTIGGTLDTAGLTAAKGSTYAFPASAAQYTAIVELSGFNRSSVTSSYIPYNSPTGPSNGGRKNPGFEFTGGIRVEIDDVKLVVTDPATTGYVAATTPAQLLRNANFNTGDSNWTFFEGAYVSTESWSEDGSGFAIIPGWSGSPYAGFMQNSVSFSPANGDFFTATFRAKFEANYKASQTIVAFMDGGGVNTLYSLDISDEIAPRLGQWHTYKATFRASPANLTAMNGQMSLKIQPLGRTANGTALSSALIDNVVLTQSDAATVGPQIAVKVAGSTRVNGDTATLLSPVLGKTTPYTVKLENQGGQNLTITSVTAGGNFTLSGLTLPLTLAPGESSLATVSATPSALGALSGTLTVLSNDKEVADQSIAVTLSATAVTLSDNFDSAVTTLSQLGWFTFASTTNLANSTTFTQSGGAMVINVNSTTDDYPWSYIVSKPFASPGPLDLATSSLQIALRAQGVYTGLTQNKVQVRLESLNAAGGVTGSIQLGSAVDETTTGAAPGSNAYFTPDGTTDRIAVLLPEGGGFTSVGGPLSSTGVNTTFDVNAPAFRLVVQITDFDFDNDSGNIVEVDSLALTLGTRRFELTNGGFESNATDPATASAPSGWAQFPVEGVSKNVITNGTSLYNALLAAADPVAVSSAYAGTKVLKVYGQNYYAGGVWQGPSQTGVVYQQFSTLDNASLAAGAVLHARGMAKVLSIDPLTGGSSFRYGFKYLDASDNEIGRDVTTVAADTLTADQWSALTVNGTVPSGAAKVQLVSEFVQNAATDGGSVYLDDLSIGFGTITPTVAISGTDYRLVWSDEFDGSALNTANWTPELGNGVNGWGNNEVQSYTDSTDNVSVSNGNLVIRAIKTGANWTSARINTLGKRSFKYGKIEFRAKLPTGQGPWPAAWMLGENFNTVGWPACGEIDVMEWKGSLPNSVSHATHSPTYNGSNALSVTVPVSSPSSNFRSYAVVWSPGLVTFSVDGVNTGSWSTADTGNPFEKEFFLLLNLAMGGNYVGNSIDPALTSATYEVDYVRVYQAASAPALSGYQTYLQNLGYSTSLAFNADIDGDGVSEGVRYAFGGSAPALGSSPASFVPGANSYTYTFDSRTDSALTLTPQVSYDLVTWSTPADYTLTTTTGAASGFTRRVLTVNTATANRIFFRLSVSN
jgi:beta-glucanase (GH16 family)